MEAPGIPENELRRMDGLQRTNLCDSQAEIRFDRYTVLASKLFDVPIALVTLVDDHRQWFKAKTGLSVAETAREVSFCGHTILDEKPLVVNNALADYRFADNPLVTGEPHVIFYAGFPIRSKRGLRIGTLCLIDHKPRELCLLEMTHLCTLSNVITAEISNHLGVTTDTSTQFTNRTGFGHLANYAFRVAETRKIPLNALIIEFVDEAPDYASDDNYQLQIAIQNLIPDIALMGQLDNRRLIALRTGGLTDEREELTVNVDGSQGVSYRIRLVSAAPASRQQFSHWYAGIQ